MGKSKSNITLLASPVSAGFPSPADDFIERELDLNDFLIKNPAATFFVKVKGDSMINAGINSGDILIIDRSITPRNNSIVVAILDGEFTVKRFIQKDTKITLMPENPKYKPININPTSDFQVWGVVTSVIKVF